MRGTDDAIPEGGAALASSGAYMQLVEKVGLPLIEEVKSA